LVFVVVTKKEGVMRELTLKEVREMLRAASDSAAQFGKPSTIAIVDLAAICAEWNVPKVEELQM
jgi:hypothetical protein